MPEEITGTAPETAPAEVIAAAAQPANQQECPQVQVERFTVAATFAPPSANDDARTIDAVWYTGAQVPRFDWRTGEEYDLILDMKGCRIDRLNNGGPVLDSHQAYGVDSQLGVVRKAWAKKATGLATVQFSKRDAVTPVWNDVKAGIIQNLSPGMWIYKKIDTTLSSVLMDLIGIPAGEPQSLAQRNLLRHLTFKVPSGQSVAKAMRLPALSSSDLADLAPFGLDTRTPLWFYLLREAQIKKAGETLGPVGGRIVAEVFIGLMQGDATSYLIQDSAWTPSLPSAGGTGKFFITDLLNFAGVVHPL